MIVLLSNGQYVEADSCVLLRDDDLTPSEWDRFSEFSHNDIPALQQRGVSVTQAEELLAEVAALVRDDAPRSKLREVFMQERPELL